MDKGIFLLIKGFILGQGWWSKPGFKGFLLEYWNCRKKKGLTQDIKQKQEMRG